MTHDEWPRIILCDVGQKEIHSLDTTRVMHMIDLQVLRFLRYDQELLDLPVEERVAKGHGIMERAPLIRFSVFGYDEDACPLWAFKEVQDWAWAWFRQQPYCILLLEDKFSLLLSLLCLGGVRSDKHQGYIPDFTSKIAPEFEALFNSSVGILLHKYRDPWLLGGFAIGQQASLFSLMTLWKEGRPASE